MHELYHIARVLYIYWIYEKPGTLNLVYFNINKLLEK